MSPGKTLLRWPALGLALLLVGFTSHPNFGSTTSGANTVAPAQAGEPITGAEIYVELEPDDEPIADVRTGPRGEFMFSFGPGRKAPAKGTFVIRVVPPKAFAEKNGLASAKPEKLRVPFDLKKDGPTFRYYLLWIKPAGKVQGRGSFAVSGKPAT